MADKESAGINKAGAVADKESAVVGMNPAITRTRKRSRILRVLSDEGVLTKICVFLILLFVLAAVFAPLLTKYSPLEQNLLEKNQGPSSEHWLGTDQLGRDLLTRLIYGARISLVTGLMSNVWAALGGVLLGLAAGYLGGAAGMIIMRLTDAMISIPPLIFTMVLAGIANGNLIGISFVIGLSLLPGYIRIINGLVISLRENDYIVAARIIGQRGSVIMVRHLLPNCFASLIVVFTMNLGTAIMLESALSYLGIGITPPTPAWGVMVADGYKFLINIPHLAIYPGICIMLLVIAFNIVGDGLRDVLDPRLRGRV